MSTKKDVSLETLIQYAEEQDNESLELFNQIGCYLDYGINNFINTFNPEQIIIGNRLAMADKWLEESILKTIQTHTLSLHRSELKLHFSKLSPTQLL